MQRDVAAVAAHHRDQAGALVGVAGLTNAVDALAGGVQRGVEADGVVGVGQVIVDGSRHAHRGKAQLVQRLSALVGAVAADAHQALHANGLEVPDGLLLVFHVQKVQAARRHQEGAAAVDAVGHAGRGENLKIVPLVGAAHQRAVVAALEADHRHVPIQRRAHHRTNRRIHARRVSAGGQNANSLHK